MKFRLSADPAVNIGARSVPLGGGRYIDVEPGGEFEILDPELAGNPTFTESGLFEPADDEASKAVRKASRSGVKEAAAAADTGIDRVVLGSSDDSPDPALVATEQAIADDASATEDSTPSPASKRGRPARNR